jgi:drug/metabolite transporter (DMT)-like permease
MSTTAIVLLTIAAVMHVAWNLGGRVAGPTPRFFRIVTGYTTLALAPLMLYGIPIFHAIRPDIWLFILVSGFFQCIYFSGLSGAYFAGHLSVAYPLARTWPALIIVFVSFLRGNGDLISSTVVAGIVLILIGSTALPIGKLSELRLKTYANRSCAFALLAAVGTAGYTIIDDAGLRTMTEAGTHPSWMIAIIWLAYESFATMCWLFVFERLNFFQIKEETPVEFSRWRAILVALAMGGTYAIVLVCYTLVDDVSYAAGFRQLSVPLGAIAGIVFLREPAPPLKLIGVSVMFAGLLLVALG